MPLAGGFAGRRVRGVLGGAPQAAGRGRAQRCRTRLTPALGAHGTAHVGPDPLRHGGVCVAAVRKVPEFPPYTEATLKSELGCCASKGLRHFLQGSTHKPMPQGQSDHRHSASESLLLGRQEGEGDKVF